MMQRMVGLGTALDIESGKTTKLLRTISITFGFERQLDTEECSAVLDSFIYPIN